MSLLEQIKTGKDSKPRRLMLYGTPGIGKSSFAAQAEKPIFIQTEDGLGEIDCSKFPLAKSFDEVIKSLEALASEKHPYKTVVIDSLDWLENLIWMDVCKEKSVKNIEDIGYAKGYTFALTQWRKVLERLTYLHGVKGMVIILIAHAQIEKFQNPETDTYDRYVPRLHKHASAIMREWCFEVLFASYKIYTKETEEGFNKKRAQGIGTGERTIRTQERPAYIAKNRLRLPDELPLEWKAYAHFFNNKKEGK